MTAGAIASLAFAKIFETTIEKFTETALGKIDRLREKIWDKLRGNPKAESALAEVENGSKADLNKVIAYLQVVMTEEPEFAKELETLAREIEAEKVQDNSTMTQINRDNSIGNQIKEVHGTTVFIGGKHEHKNN